jgi:hypothetical protein
VPPVSGSREIRDDRASNVVRLEEIGSLVV